MGSTGLRQLLKSLCKDSYWNYAVLWQIRHGNPMVLTWEDGYCDNQKAREPIETISDDCCLGDGNEIYSSCDQINMYSSETHSIEQGVSHMSSFCYNLGEGIVGKVAYMQNHSWINLDKVLFGEDSCNLIHEGRFPEEWLYQWALGIKTILLIPLLPQGVLQLGSLEEVSEDFLVISNIKSRFMFHYNGLTSAPFIKNKDFEAELSSLLIYSSVVEFDETSAIIDESTEIDDVQLKMSCETENQVVPVLNPEVTFYINQSEILESASHMEMVESELSSLEQLHYSSYEGMFEEFSDSVADFYTMEQSFKEEYILGFPNHSELHKALGPSFQEQAIESSWDSSFLVDDIYRNDFGLISDRDHINIIAPSLLEGDAGDLLGAVVANKYTGLEEKSDKSSIISSGVSSLVSNEQPRNSFQFMESKKGAKPFKVSKTKAKPGENQKPRPRDRQMIQDRLKEMRELVPNGTKVTAGLKSQSTKINDDPHKGTSWVFELEKGHQVCPVVVEDLPLPGFLLIEMLCDHDSFFLEITSEILRLKLTILKGATEIRAAGTWAYFIVEMTKGFHRTDIFWPLMNLLHRQRYMAKRKLDVL
ncbi:hypothetical protein ACFE04_003159 [Oxalis oulophora]